MRRLSANKPGNSLTGVEEFRRRLERATAASGQAEGLSPAAVSALLTYCTEQSCKKCVPCRIGLAHMRDVVFDVLEGYADSYDLDLLERCAWTLHETCECEIGYESARIVLESIPAWDVAEEGRQL